MTVAVWRIAAETSTYKADDMTGEGARITGGRWNKPGEPLIYASENRSLSCLETLVHLKAYGLPLSRYLVRIDIADEVWAAARRENPASLPAGWDSLSVGPDSQDFGSAWLAGRTSALLILPSAIVPEEHNILINPLHPDHSGITATKVRRWLYDPRLGT